jgi:hypothetical protein
MKKALALIATLSAFISIQQVSAVDYVACREMLRTKNEMINLAKEKDEEHTSILIYQKCSAYTKWEEEDKKNNAGYYALFKSSSPRIASYDIRVDCLSKEKSVLFDFGLFYSKEAINFAKGAVTVIKDMKKARCPYQ